MRGPQKLAPVLLVLGCANTPARPGASADGVVTHASSSTVAPRSCGALSSKVLPGAVELPSLSGASVRIRSPSTVVPVQGVLEAPVELQVANAVLGADEFAVAVALDARAPRRIESLGRRLTLGDLIFEDDAIMPGEHVIVAALVRARDGAVVVAGPDRAPAVAARRFVVGKKPSSTAAAGPLLVLLEPHGTYNGGDAGDRVVVSLAVVGGPSCVRLGVSGPSVSASWTVAGTHAFRLNPLDSGDYDVHAELLDQAGRAAVGPMASAERTIVVNRDAPAGGEP